MGEHNHLEIGVIKVRPDFIVPDFIKNNSADEIHQRMMGSLPDDIDDMPGGFPYDFTKPAALEKDELINYHLVRAIMLAFPQYSWDEWLDLHGRQAHIARHGAARATGEIEISGIPGTKLSAGAVLCSPATDAGPAIGFRTLEECTIGESGVGQAKVEAVEAGTGSNVNAGAVSIMAKPVKGVTGITNPEPIRGGTGRESDDDFYDRIAAEYENSLTYLGNDSDYIRWAKEAGAGDCIVVPALEEPGVVKLVLIDGNGQPANENLVRAVYNHIVSPADRSMRILPTGCARLECVPATTVLVSFKCTGILHDGTTDIGQIKKDFAEAVKAIYASAKKQDILRYNDVRPVISGIVGVTDFNGFLMNGEMRNIELSREEYPETGTLDFCY